MGKYLDKFKKKEKKFIEKTINTRDKVQHIGDKKVNHKTKWKTNRLDENNNSFDIDENIFDDNFEDDPYDVNIQPAQKPESFHHFILENQYKDLEKSIRGYKDVYNKNTEKWEIKRKGEHCFTDEEAEDIIRMVQSHLATDIKLTLYNKETFGIRLMAIMNAIKDIFRNITEYNFGRFGDITRQERMKLQAFKIYVEVITRIEANYLRAVGGAENIRTHQSVQSQESLQGGRDDDYMNRRYT